MFKSLVQVSLALFTAVASSSALAASYFCTNQDGNVIKIKKASTQKTFKLKIDDGDVYTCRQVRTSGPSGSSEGSVRGGFLQRRLPNGGILICNTFRCYTENPDDYNPWKSGGAI